MNLDFGDWSEWRQHVLIELKRLNSNLESIELDIRKDREEVWKRIVAIETELKVKAGLYGAVGGLLTTILGILANKHL
jgi:hypothetical protein